jgi:hypothetical protein
MFGNENRAKRALEEAHMECERIFRDKFVDELKDVIADHLEIDGNCLDDQVLVLATYLMACLEAYNATLPSDEKWYAGRTETEVFDDKRGVYYRDNDEERQKDALNPEYRDLRRSLILVIDYYLQNDAGQYGSEQYGAEREKSYDLASYLLDCLEIYNRTRRNWEKRRPY